jgi:hypothetical protein
VVLPAVTVAVGALELVRRRVAPVAAALLLVNVLLYVVFLPTSVDVDYGAAGRAAVGVVLATLYCVPAWSVVTASSGRAAGVVLGSLGWGALLSWSLAWYLLVARHYGLPGIDLITT